MAVTAAAYHGPGWRARPGRHESDIAGGTNSVTVADSVTGGTLRFAILEYAGVAVANSLDSIKVLMKPVA